VREKQGTSYYPESAASRRVSTVHVEDLAALYVLVLNDVPSDTLVNAPVEPPISGLEIAEAVAVAAGIPGEVEAIPEDRYIEMFRALGIFQKNMVVSPNRANGFGWRTSARSALDVLKGN